MLSGSSLFCSNCRSCCLSNCPLRTWGTPIIRPNARLGRRKLTKGVLDSLQLLNSRLLTDVGSDHLERSFVIGRPASQRNTHRYRSSLTNLTPNLQLKRVTKQPFKSPTQQ